MTKQVLLDKAIKAVQADAGLQIKVAKRDTRLEGRIVDAVIRLPSADVQLLVEVKKWAGQANVGAIAHQMQELAELGKGLLVADYINPNMAERLKALDIQFLDAAGNAYINQPPVYLYIKGNRPADDGGEHQNLKTGKAFQTTGMKVVLAFMMDRDLINAPYRDIAERAQVALGAVGAVIKDLNAQGYLADITGKKKRELIEFNRLLTQWVEAYPIKLRQKYRLGTFTTDNPAWWQAIDIAKFNALWGGEVAAAKYTNYLNPKDAVVYIKQADMSGFIKAARLRKYDAGQQTACQVELVDLYWQQEQGDGLAHPVITYADLIETGEPRNLDTANRLHEKYLH